LLDDKEFAKAIKAAQDEVTDTKTKTVVKKKPLKKKNH